MDTQKGVFLPLPRIVGGAVRDVLLGVKPRGSEMCIV